MNVDDFHHQLGSFIASYSRMLDAQRLAPQRDPDYASKPEWQSVPQHLAALEHAHSLLIAYPVGSSKADEDYVSADRFDPSAGVRISPEILRAMAFDAATIADIAMAGVAGRPWWYDPNAADGKTANFGIG